MNRLPHRSLALATLVMLLAGGTAQAVQIGEPAPPIAGRTWLNRTSSAPHEFAGGVTLVEFWTYGCWNCRNVEPYVKTWSQRYARQGLTIVAVHTPEFKHEYDVDNVRRYLRERGIAYPVVIDNDFAVWNAYANRYWPAIYLVDRRGVVRYIRIGEGAYTRTERMIQELLAERDGRE